MSSTPGPRPPRIKTYAAESGYGYEYRFQKHERTGDAHRYVFDVFLKSETVHVTVLVPLSSIEIWQTAQERELDPTERYAIAKLALFGLLDRAPQPNALERDVRVGAHELTRIAAVLDL